MAGRGRAPKDPERRAGHSRRDSTPLRILPRAVETQPRLPAFYVIVDGSRKLFRWPTVTRQWWQMWADSPLSAEFTSIDWSELLDTAMLHAVFWQGDSRVAGELRLRVSKFGATPEDRARLRIQFAQAAESERKVAESSSRSRFENFTVPPDDEPPAEPAPALSFLIAEHEPDF